MRIKCPNSDIFLELPGDRTDMKFTCPACHKVHRVTVTISTPGEDKKEEPKSRSVTRAHPHMPKKYATGAYAPVVDIPIDANFILLDSDGGNQQGIDLGGMTSHAGVDLGTASRPFPASVDEEMASRNTEIFREKPSERKRRHEEGGETAEARDEGEKAPIITPPPGDGNEGKVYSGGEPAADEIALQPEPESKPDSKPEQPLNPEPFADFDQGSAMEPNSDAAKSEADVADGRRLWDAVEETAAPVAPVEPAPELPPQLPPEPPPEDVVEKTPPAPADVRVDIGHSGRYASRRQKRRPLATRPAVVIPAAILALLLAFFGWQQYRFENNRQAVEDGLSRAESALGAGDIPGSARAARDAKAAFAKNDSFLTAKNVWNKFAAWAGLPPFSTDGGETSRKIEAYIERERQLQSFAGGLDAANPVLLAEKLKDDVEAVADGGDARLAEAMRWTVADKAVAELRAMEESSTPEQIERRSRVVHHLLSPHLSSGALASFNEKLDDIAAKQAERLLDELRRDASITAADARAGNPAALKRYAELAKRLAKTPSILAGVRPELRQPVAELAEFTERDALAQLERLTDLMEQASRYAKSALGRPEPDEKFIDDLAETARGVTSPSPEMAQAAARAIANAHNETENLFRIQMDLYSRVQSEMRRDLPNAGTQLAWSMLRTAFGDPDVEVDASTFRFDNDTARIELTFEGIPVVMEMGPDDLDTRIRAKVGGFNFTSGWALLFHKPVSWMASLADAMERSGVDPMLYPDWEVLEGPGAPLALTLPPGAGSDSALASGSSAAGTRHVFFHSKLWPIVELPLPADSRRLVADFRQAAERLHDGIMGDTSIPQQLRQALKPVLMGAYQKPDPRDYFDSAFCRRLIEADYLESYIDPMPDDRKRELDFFRLALEKLEAGYDEFSVEMGGGERLVAVAQLDPDLAGDGRSGDQDPETGESLPRYTWRHERDGTTVFFSPFPARFVYALSLAEHYDGIHRMRPKGRPSLTEVWHARNGMLASYESGGTRAYGDVDLWNRSLAEDLIGRFDTTMGPPGWNFPPHVIERDDQGDPLVLATISGIVESPDFSDIQDPAARREAEDRWLDSTARTLSSPGELGLIFHQFFRYCSDSPLPELPNLIGSHYGLSDTHQTVYQSLERRWVGRLIGDCDDLAEFFQELTRRQGKLSHVMQLPGHAACGYVEKGGGAYQFVVLQTGPVLQFTALTLNDVVESAYRFFDRDGGLSHMTTDAVPLLLRFADEETRTPFVLSARIYDDADYAETMIRVQAFWHEHAYSAALRVMEDMVKADQEIGNIKELGSLYERVGMYDKSEEMRRRELRMVSHNPPAAISTLLEIAQLHVQDKNKEKALTALGEMETRMVDMVRRDDAQNFFNVMSFRSYWAMFLSRLGQPAKAWELVKFDANATKRQMGRVADPILHTMVTMYERLRMKQETPGAAFDHEEERVMHEIENEILDAFSKGYFRPDDAYNAIIGRYFTMGRFAVAQAGRTQGLAMLRTDGPYPDAPKDQTKRGRRIEPEDWAWFRITPQLYLAFALEMLDRDEYPELFNPEAAKPLLLEVERAVRNGAGLGSDVAGGDDVVKSALTLSFLDNDIEAFRNAMSVVKEKNYSSLYDDAAMTFGLHCGFVPLSEFPAWCEAFREFFPGSQHYFKVVYRAIDKENYDHALMMAEATARFFPDNQLLAREAEFVAEQVPLLKERKMAREIRGITGGAEEPAEIGVEVLQPAA